MKMSYTFFKEGAEDFFGYCTKCDDVTEWGGVEGDAMNYHCPECKRKTVMGVETAMIMGYIEISKEQANEEIV